MNGNMLHELREMADKNPEDVSQKAMNRLTLSGLADIIEAQQEAAVLFRERGEGIEELKKSVETLASEVQLKADSNVCRLSMVGRIDELAHTLDDNLFIKMGVWASKKPKTSVAIIIVTFLFVDILGHKLLPYLILDPNLLEYIQNIVQ